MRLFKDVYNTTAHVRKYLLSLLQTYKDVHQSLITACGVIAQYIDIRQPKVRYHYNTI